MYTRNSICPGCVSGTDLVLKDCVVWWELGRLVGEGKAEGVELTQWEIRGGNTLEGVPLELGLRRG